MPPDSPFLAAFSSALSRRLKPPAVKAEERRTEPAPKPHGMSFEEWMRSERRSEDIARAYADHMPLD